eukprot:scaffold12070_cov39-Isochrysis_galbana.AAC.1
MLWARVWRVSAEARGRVGGGWRGCFLTARLSVAFASAAPSGPAVEQIESPIWPVREVITQPRVEWTRVPFGARRRMASTTVSPPWGK